MFVLYSHKLKNKIQNRCSQLFNYTPQKQQATVEITEITNFYLLLFIVKQLKSGL